MHCLLYISQFNNFHYLTALFVRTVTCCARCVHSAPRHTVCLLSFVLKLFTALDALVKWTFVIFVCLQAIQSRAQMAMGYGGYGGVMMQPPVAMPMPVPMAYPQQDQTTTTTRTTRNGGGGGGGYGTIVIPIPQFVTVTFKIPNANDGRDNNQDSCENHKKRKKDRKCQKCPPCSCNPCTPVVFAFCSPCHDQCKCKGDESSERRRTSTPSAPNGNAYPMPYPPVIYLPLPDFNKNNGKRPGNKCPKCESSSSCSSSTSSCEEDSCNSRGRGKKKNHDHHRGHKKKVPYDICRKNGECGDNSQELRRFQVKRGPQVAKKLKPSYKSSESGLGWDEEYYRHDRDETRRGGTRRGAARRGEPRRGKMRY